MGKNNMLSSMTRGLRVGVALFLLAAASTATAERMTANAFQSALDAVKNYAITEGEHPYTEELEAIDAAVIASQGDNSLRNAHADALAKFLASEDTGVDAKWFAARQLQRIAGPGQVETIAPLLTKPDMSDIAIYALQDIPGSEATGALISALDDTAGAVKVGLINALGARRDPAALPVLMDAAPRLSAVDAEVYAEVDRAIIYAALNAIMSIGGADADRFLSDHIAGIRQDPQRRTALDTYFRPYITAWLAVAQSLDSTTEQRNVIARYTGYEQLRMPVHFQTAMLFDIVRNLPNFPDVVLQFFQNPSMPEQSALSLLWYLEDPDALRQIAVGIDELPYAVRGIAVEAIAERGIAEAVPGAVSMAASPDADMRRRALAALGFIGGVDEVPLLLNTASAPNPTFAQAASQSLIRMQADGVNDAIIAHMQSGGAGVRVAGIEVLVARQAEDASDVFWAGTEDTNAQVRAAALRALAARAEADTAARIARFAVQATDTETRDAATSAMIDAARRTGTQGEVAQVVLETLDEATNEEGLYTVAIATLGRLDHPSALPALVEAARSSSVPVQLAAIRALSDWQTTEPLELLMDIADKHDDTSIRTLATRNAVAMVGRLPEDDVDAKLTAYKQILAMGIAPSEVRRVLAGVAQLSSQDALALAQSFLDDDELRADAEFAVARIRASMASPTASLNTDDAHLVLDGNADTRWTTGQLQHPGQWFQLSFSEPTALAGIVLDSAGSASDYPRAYSIYISDDGESWGEPIATGTGSEGVTRIEFEGVTTNAIRIEQTGTADANFWSIHTLEVISHE